MAAVFDTSTKKTGGHRPPLQCAARFKLRNGLLIPSALEIETRAESKLPVRASVVGVGETGTYIRRIHAAKIRIVYVRVRVVPPWRIQDVDNVHPNFHVFRLTHSNTLHKVHVK